MEIISIAVAIDGRFTLVKPTKIIWKYTARFSKKIDKNHDNFMEHDTIESFPHIFVVLSHGNLYYNNYNGDLVTPNGNDNYNRYTKSSDKPPVELIKIFEELRAKLDSMKSKRFVLFEPDKTLYCADSNDVFVKFANEIDNRGHIGKKMGRLELYETVDISFSAYLTLTGLKVVSKEEELKSLKQEMHDILGCQKDSLSPLLESFLKFAADFNNYNFRSVSEEKMAAETVVEVIRSRVGPTELIANSHTFKMKGLVLKYLERLNEK